MLSWRKTWASHGVREAPEGGRSDLGREGRAGVLEFDLPGEVGGAHEGTMLCSHGCVESSHHLVFVVCKWGPAGAGSCTRSSGQWLTHSPGFCHLPAFPASKGRLSAGALGPLAGPARGPGRVRFRPCAVWGVRTAVPGRGCQDHGQRGPAGFGPPSPLRCQCTPGGGLSPSGGGSGPVRRGTASSAPHLRPGHSRVTGWGVPGCVCTHQH